MSGKGVFKYIRFGECMVCGRPIKGSLQAENKALKARLAAIEEAVEPMKKFVEEIDSFGTPDTVRVIATDMVHGDFRNLINAVKGKEPKDGDTE